METQALLNNYIHTHIPITLALGANIKHASKEKIIVSAPISNNINHKHTVFGGSLHAITTIACWGLLYANFIDQLGKMEIVISHSEIDYKIPVTHDFEAVSVKPSQEIWDKFENMFNRKGKSRIEIHSQIIVKTNLAVDYKGQFVVIKSI